MNCPFKKGQGQLFQLGQGRLNEILESDAFQCHKTVDYDGPPDSEGNATTTQGDRPQQCAGLMAVLIREGKLNQIMQVAYRLGYLKLESVDPKGEAYGSIEEVRKAHGGKDV